MLTRFKEWGILKGDETCIYYYDSKTKQQSSIWVYRDEPKSTKWARERSASKRMIVSFFNKTGHMAIVVLENCHTANNDCYLTPSSENKLLSYEERLTTFYANLASAAHDITPLHPSPPPPILATAVPKATREVVVSIQFTFEPWRASPQRVQKLYQRYRQTCAICTTTKDNRCHLSSSMKGGSIYYS
ncbi:hypothetical protein EVAR_51123_1 [Eumeta japonica]|uniref:Mariner Mos1 transposase n=1 Tax=Eumeta variegata TaxID=151549 RepID=A0A4C1Y8E4_EUMVA|nr:hypothetical protein EVAR_51123_1 [Eumeta japonica]